MTEPHATEPHATESQADAPRAPAQGDGAVEHQADDADKSQDDEVADLVSKIAEQVAREEEEASLYSGPKGLY